MSDIEPIGAIEIGLYSSQGFSSDAGLYRLISLPHLFPPHWSWVFIGLGGVQGDP
ncbi:MAG: hypothetical protein QXH88_06100 [Sulfolobales archaeon]